MHFSSRLFARKNEKSPKRDFHRPFLPAVVALDISGPQSDRIDGSNPNADLVALIEVTSMIDSSLHPQRSLTTRMGLWGRLRVLLAGGCLTLAGLGNVSVLAQETSKPPEPAPVPPVTAPAAPQPPEPGTPASIEQQQPKFFVHAEAD